ncbi:MAG: helix-turn-helix domain-containing protein [Candidatus Anammoxibacter sp.]
MKIDILDQVEFSFTETAKRLHLTRNALQEALNDGKIKGYQCGKRTRFTEKQMAEYKEGTLVDNTQPKAARFNPDDYPAFQVKKKTNK